MVPSKYRLVDTHAHICDPAFDKDRAKALESARSAGVAAIIAVGENLSDARKNLELAERYSMLKPAAGLYPDILDINQADEMADFILQNHSVLAAIGEVGLDYWVVKEAPDRALQREIFK
ncbi:MAG: TatD family hydrolase, partial [Desulfobacterales bacterium]